MNPAEDPVSETIETYNQYAEEYAKKWGEGWEDFKEFRKKLDEFIKNLPGKDVLEIGCGAGRDAKYLTENGIDVTAIELSKSFVDIASKTAPKAKIISMDMRHLDFQDNSFDGIWAAASFLHIPKSQAKATLMGFGRVLKPGGLMFISMKAGQGEGFIRKDAYKGNAKYFALYTEPEFKDLLESGGFEIKSIVSEKKIYGTRIAVVATKKGRDSKYF